MLTCDSDEEKRGPMTDRRHQAIRLRMASFFLSRLQELGKASPCLLHFADEPAAAANEFWCCLPALLHQPGDLELSGTRLR